MYKKFASTTIPNTARNFQYCAHLCTSHAIIPLNPDCKTTFFRIFYIFLCNFKFLRPEHDCYAKFTSCST